MTIDGFVAGPNGEMDWMTSGADDELMSVMNALTDSSDTMLLGRKMNDGFVDFWTSVLEQPENPLYIFARKMVDMPKVVFSKTVKESKWANTTIANGDLVEEVEKLKQREGKDIIVYGGATFVSNLIKENLIDEFNLFINPTAIGSGLTIFSKMEGNLKLELINSQRFECGEVHNTYQMKRD